MLSRSTVAGSQASTPADDAIGTASTAVSCAPQSAASSMARRKDLRDLLEPSTPITIFLTGVNCRSVPRAGTTTTGQREYAGSAEEVAPSSLSVNPPVPLVPTTIKSACCDSCTSTAVGSPGSTRPSAWYPSFAKWLSASSTTVWALARMASLSITANPLSIDAAVYEGKAYAHTICNWALFIFALAATHSAAWSASREPSTPTRMFCFPAITFALSAASLPIDFYFIGRATGSGWIRSIWLGFFFAMAGRVMFGALRVFVCFIGGGKLIFPAGLFGVAEFFRPFYPA